MTGRISHTGHVAPRSDTHPMSDRDDEVPLRAPRNALPPPPDRELLQLGSAEMLMLVRLDWGHTIEVRPCRIQKATRRAVCVEWQHKPGAKKRWTWVPRADIHSHMVLR